MQILTFTIEIQASPQKVWNALFDPQNYRLWTNAFHPGTYYLGELKEKNEILLLTNEGHGMFSILDTYKPFEQLTFMHQGEIVDGKKAEVIYENAFESYFLHEIKNGTQLNVSLNCEEEYIEKMNQLFPKALKRVKEIAEED
ncbi:MAG: hypothetical protein Q4G27_02495 [Flavobacteriaceae bacterium]|nr:hypothetical protein [Flavobacteriaceae bacterium]